jgi:hypothetical protein
MVGGSITGRHNFLFNCAFYLLIVLFAMIFHHGNRFKLGLFCIFATEAAEKKWVCFAK